MRYAWTVLSSFRYRAAKLTLLVQTVADVDALLSTVTKESPKSLKAALSHRKFNEVKLEVSVAIEI